jgi:hypothetical protein
MLTKYRGLNLQGWKGCRPTCHSEGEEEIKKKKDSAMQKVRHC